MTATAPETEPLPAPPARRRCPNCPAEFDAGGRGLGKLFCSTSCQQQWNARNKARGAVMAPMILAYAATGSARPGTPEAEIRRIAQSEMMTMARTFLAEDREAGRMGLLGWANEILIERQSRYMDRRLKA